MDKGNYCSNCGASLNPRYSSTIMQFLEFFFKTGELKVFGHTFISILRAPITTIMRFTNEGNARRAFAFLGYCATIYIVFSLSKFWIIREMGFVEGMLFTSQFVFTLSVSIPLLFTLCNYVTDKKHSFHEFMILSSYFVGFNIVFVTIGSLFYLFNLWLGTVVNLVILVPIMIYTLKLLKRFWHLPIWLVFIFLFIAGIAGSIVSLGILFGAAQVLDIEMLTIEA